MKNLKSILAIAFSLALFSCSTDDELIPDQTQSSTVLPVQTFSNLFAPTSGPPPETTGDFVKFSFSTGQIVTSGDNWDVAFLATSIILNGGVAATGQPARTGIGAGSIISGTFENITTAPADNLFNQDSATGNAIPTGSGDGWYTYTRATNVVSPIAGKVIVIRTHDGNYAKMEILNYYLDAPANPIGTDPSRYYKFNFVYQPNGTKNF
jgi:hypothetical protein